MDQYGNEQKNLRDESDDGFKETTKDFFLSTRL